MLDNFRSSMNSQFGSDHGPRAGVPPFPGRTERDGLTLPKIPQSSSTSAQNHDFSTA